MPMARITRWSPVPLVVVFMSTALAPPSLAGSITFTGNVKFLNPFNNQATYPSTNCAGGLRILGIKPGGDQLNNTDTGFVYTNAEVEYTAAPADIGETVGIFWMVSRPFTNTAGNFTTSSSLSGTVTVPAGSLIKSIFANTYWFGAQGGTSSEVDVGPFDNTNGGADKTFNMVRGGGTVTVTSAPFAAPASDKGTYLVEVVRLFLDPSKAGQLYKFDFPDSVVGATNAVPEPSSLILIAIAGSAVAASSRVASRGGGFAGSGVASRGQWLRGVKWLRGVSSGFAGSGPVFGFPKWLRGVRAGFRFSSHEGGVKAGFRAGASACAARPRGRTDCRDGR